jgi:hypothetical protein
MANNAAELIVAGNGAISVAPVGTPLPTSPTASLNAAFLNLGYATEDGVTFTATPDVKDYRAWQSKQAVRREVNAREVQAAFALEQWNEDTVPLAFGGGEITVTGTDPNFVYKYTLPLAGDALDERSLVIDFEDGDRNGRIVVPRGNITDAVETKFQATDLAVLPITFKALEPTDGSAIAYFLFNDSAFATA